VSTELATLKMKNEMEESMEVVDHLADRRARELGSTSSDSDEDYSVDDVCDEIGKAEFYQTLAENAMKNATKTALAMNEMSKDYSHYKDVQKIIKKAQECYDKVEKEKDDTIEKMENVKEQCEKAKEKPEDASKFMKAAKKKREDVAKEALKANKELLKLKEEEDKMLEMGEVLGFDPVMTELEETIKQDNEKLESDIEKIEEEIKEIDTEAAETVDIEEQKLLEQNREEYIKQEKELQDILASNEKFINSQDDMKREIYYSSILGRSNQQGGPLQIILASYGDQTKGMANWGRNSKTSTLQDWFEKFASLVLDELKKGLPKFNSTSGGCLDGPFGLIVNVTEVEGVLDQEEVKCEIPEYDDR
jgi:chromosome segregation ATPase